MKRKSMALLLCVCLLFSCTACQSEQDDIYSQAVADQQSTLSALSDSALGEEISEEPVDEDGLSGELVIRMRTQTNLFKIDSLAIEFMNLHPDVTITIEADYSDVQWANFSDTERRMNQESYRTQLRTEIASGEADYLIFDFDEDLDLTPLTQVGALYDMREFWENDPDIREEDLFMSVIEAFQVDGKMTAIPYAFRFPTVTFSQHVIDDVGIDLTGVHTVSVTQLLDWYDEARAHKPELNLIFTSQSKETLFFYERPDYIDLVTGTSSFDSTDFVEFLERTVAVNAEEPDLRENDIGMGDTGFASYWEEYWETGKMSAYIQNISDQQIIDIVTKTREWFCIPENQIFKTSFTLQQPLAYQTQPYALISTDGKLVIDSHEAFAVPSSLKNKELAWEFIKYCLNTREDPTFSQALGVSELYTYGIPVNKENYWKGAEHLSAGGTYTGYSLGYPANYPGLDPDATVEEMEAMLSVNTVYAGAYNVDVQEYLDEYYVNDLISAEECAKKIQDRTYMWLNE